MGSDFAHIKRHFDLSMSRRTRKSAAITQPSPDRNKVIPKEEDEEEEEEDIIARRTLKKLIESDGEEKIDGGCKSNDLSKLIKEKIGDDASISKDGEGKIDESDGRSKGGQGSNSLGHHFLEEEKHLPLVKQGEFVEGVKLSGMVSRYIKVLNHLIKIKRDSRRGSRKRERIRLSTT